MPIPDGLKTGVVRVKPGIKKPRHLLECWKQIAKDIRQARRIALFADFDGTLVRIERDAGQVRLAPGVRRLLARIASRGAIVGVVSGRTIADVRRCVGLKQLWYAGAHGFFLRDPSNRSFALAAPSQVRSISAARQVLEQRLRKVPGVRLEPKEATIAVHYRGAPARSERIARRAVSEALKEHSGLRLLSGKKLLELLPGSRIDKWTAISFILGRVRRHHSAHRRVIFIGDDVTDERVFEKLRGISVAIGKKHRTAAKYYLKSPAEVRRFLERLEESTS